MFWRWLIRRSIFYLLQSNICLYLQLGLVCLLRLNVQHPRLFTHHFLLTIWHLRCVALFKLETTVIFWFFMHFSPFSRIIVYVAREIQMRHKNLVFSNQTTRAIHTSTSSRLALICGTWWWKHRSIFLLDCFLNSSSLTFIETGYCVLGGRQFRWLQIMQILLINVVVRNSLSNWPLILKIYVSLQISSLFASTSLNKSLSVSLQFCLLFLGYICFFKDLHTWFESCLRLLFQNLAIIYRNKLINKLLTINFGWSLFRKSHLLWNWRHRSFFICLYQIFHINLFLSFSSSLQSWKSKSFHAQSRNESFLRCRLICLFGLFFL